MSRGTCKHGAWDKCVSVPLFASEHQAGLAGKQWTPEAAKRVQDLGRGTSRSGGARGRGLGCLFCFT